MMRMMMTGGRKEWLTNRTVSSSIQHSQKGSEAAARGSGQVGHSKEAAPSKRYIGAIDQGTQSTRFIIYSYDKEQGLQALATGQVPVELQHPQAGWTQQKPADLVQSVQEAMQLALNSLASGEVAGGQPPLKQLDGIGITNQRETTIAWDADSGLPLYEGAISWMDSRTHSLLATLQSTVCRGDGDRFKQVCGLPLSTYFSVLKMRWLLDNVSAVQRSAKQGTLRFGTVDSWLLYHLTGGAVHATDVTNASRTMLMNLRTLQWDPELCQQFGIPLQALPHIRPSSCSFGHVAGGPESLLHGTPILGVVGDQQAALLGQHCFEAGEAKNTYGTGCFLLANTGYQPVFSSCGLLTTVGFQFEGQPAAYALEGSIAIAGAGIKWLRDNLGLVASPVEAAQLAASVSCTNDVYFVPAFGGLFAPYWRPDARGCILGLTQYSTKAHIIRAMFESIAFQTREILQGIQSDTGIKYHKLRVDGGMVQSDMLLQFQADVLDLPVIRPRVIESTAMGAAIAALIGTGVSFDEYRSVAQRQADLTTFAPSMDDLKRARIIKGWDKAVLRSLDWVDDSSSSSFDAAGSSSSDEDSNHK